MNADQDTTRIVRSWLRTDEHESADRVLGDVLALLDATPQHRPLAVRRIARMHPFAKLIAAVAAVVVVAVVGVNLLAPRTQGPGGQAPLPSPSGASPSPPATPANAPVKGSLAAGAYRISESFHTVRPFTFTVPDGWRRDENFVYNSTGDLPTDVFEDGDGVSMATWVVSHIYRDSCDWEGTLERVTTVEEVVEALAAQTGHDSTEPTTTTLGGHPATRLEFSLPADADLSACARQFARLWPDAGPNEDFGLPITPGQAMTVYVVDIDGNPTLIIAISNDSTPAADAAALEQVIQSIQFD